MLTTSAHCFGVVVLQRNRSSSTQKRNSRGALAAALANDGIVASPACAAAIIHSVFNYDAEVNSHTTQGGCDI